jgi:polyisoprenoid-binding protein YceI
VAPARPIRLSAENTRITFAVRWMGLLTVRGAFRQMSGELRIPNGDIESSSVSLDVRAASVHTGIALRDRHLRGRDFLDCEAHPVIAFESQRVERVNGAITIAGRLVLRGVEREIVARSPLCYAEGEGLGSTISLDSEIRVPRLPHGVGTADGIKRLNPLLHAIGDVVTVSIRVLAPAHRLLPALLPALGR